MNHSFLIRSTIVVLAAALCVGLAAAKGKPPVELSNNLSYPAVYTAGEPDEFLWEVPATQETFEYFAYGCDVPYSDEQFSYPNTACVLDDDNAYLTPEACVAAGAPCDGFTVDQLSRIYHQKVADNLWSADTYLRDPATPVAAAFVDWSDNIESNSWTTRSVIRLETQPYDASPADQTAFTMWHISGHGPDEHWGVRATEAAEPYLYEWPFAIVHTSAARLNFAKLETGDATCPEPAGEPMPPPALALDWSFDPVTRTGRWISDGTTAIPDPCQLKDENFTVELNVGGKYVYGYNWKPRRDVLPGSCVADGFVKEGWWRLTFYTTEDQVLFLDTTRLGPPVLDEPPATEADTGPLYTPIVDPEHNLTYIDICLTRK